MMGVVAAAVEAGSVEGMLVVSAAIVRKKNK